MTQTDYIARMRQIAQDRHAQDRPATAAQRPALPKARNRRERVALALIHLQKAGIGGAMAYSPLFHALARIGLPPKPLHYRSLTGQFLFGFFTITLVMGGTVLACLFMGLRPRPIQALLAAGPEVFLGITATLGAIFALVYRVQAISARLPRWRDL